MSNLHLATLGLTVSLTRPKPWYLVRGLQLLVGLIGVGHGRRFIKKGYLYSKAGDNFIVPLLDWIPVSHALQIISVVLLIAASAAVAANVFARPAAVTAACCLAYVLLSDWQAFHHSSFLGLNMFLLLAWMGSPDPRHRWAAIWGMRALVMAVYLFAGIHKAVGHGFRQGWVIEQLLDSTKLGRAAYELVPYLPRISAWGTIVLELGLPFLLLHPRTRLWAVPVGVAFHMGMLMLTGRGSVFHFYLPAAYLAFFMQTARVSQTVRAPQVHATKSAT